MNKIIKKSNKNICRQLHKFGGSTLSDIKSYQYVIDIIVNYINPGDLIVVSASGNTTNLLINWAKLVKIDSFLASKIKKKIILYHENLIIGLLKGNYSYIVKLKFLKDFAYLEGLLKNNINDNIYAEIVCYGEIWSARLMSAILMNYGLKSMWIDARLFLKAERCVPPKIIEKISVNLINKFLEKTTNDYIVITGFIASDTNGKTLLLGRNGSDYSATQIASLINIKKVTIWSDVSGIYTADPKKVKDAKLLKEIDVKEANELARLSGSVLHDRTLQPIFFSNISLYLKCSFCPEENFTKIKRFTKSPIDSKIILSRENICLIEVISKNRKNFRNFYKKIYSFLYKKNFAPLAININLEKKIIKFCYSMEFIDYVIKLLKTQIEMDLLNMRCCFSLIAIVGKDICKKSFYVCMFYRFLRTKKVELIYHTKNKISMIAILNENCTLSALKELHRIVFYNKQNDNNFL